MKNVFCIHNAPRQTGDLWVKVEDGTVKVMDPAGTWWRGKTFTVEEFCKVFKETK